MNGKAQRGAALMECIAPLNEEDRRALHAYWSQVIWEEWLPPVRRVPSPVPSEADTRRERREARRAVARIVAASQMCPAMPSSGKAAAAVCMSPGTEAA